MNKEYENTIKTKLLEQQNETLKQNIADKEAFVKEMKTVRHDIKNQLLTILQYANEGRCDDIKDYVNALTNNYLPNILNYISTDNIAFDAIINSKIAVCSQRKIFMEVNIKKDTDINIPPVETAVLFGNLLDNAIEAAKDTEEKRISVDICKNASYLVISVTNSIKSSVLTNNKNLETTKSDTELHGIGIKSVKNIVEKYNGMIKFFEEENEFCCHIMIDTTEE
ncbi:MAG: sensor histidine kinase [Clostridia bacterium]|nr:sensor histidine kinase [Clostridia bacterium]